MIAFWCCSRVVQIWTKNHVSFSTWQSYKLSPFPWMRKLRKLLYCIWNSIFNKMLIGLRAMEYIYWNQTKLIPPRRQSKGCYHGHGQWTGDKTVVCRTASKSIQSRAQYQDAGWLKQEENKKAGNRTSAEEVWGCTDKLVQLEAGWEKMFIYLWHPTAGDTGSCGTALYSNPF